jgi:hypothetical protein
VKLYGYIHNYLLKYKPGIGKPIRANIYTPVRNITSNNSVVRLTGAVHESSAILHINISTSPPQFYIQIFKVLKMYV